MSADVEKILGTLRGMAGLDDKPKAASAEEGLYRAAALVRAFAKAKRGQIIPCSGKAERAVLEACAELAASRSEPRG